MSTTDVTVRAIDEAEIPAFVRTDAAGFGESDAFAKLQPRWVADELDRTRVAFCGDELVATSRNYSFELTVPGGGLLPAAGVSAVAVLPTHRRQGILRRLMTALFDDAATRGESVAMLTASEGGIYARFGFGVTTRASSVEIKPRAAEFARPRPAGRLRLVAPDDALKAAPEVYERVRRAHPGAISRTDIWFAECQYPPELGTRFDVLYESPAGAVDGFVSYGIKANWGPTEGEHRLRVSDLIAATPEATHALWRYLCEIDLVGTIRMSRVPLDSPLAWLLVSPRGARTTSIDDYVWTRLLDVPVALGARTYATPGTLGFDVTDRSRPEGAAAGTFTLDGGSDGATVTRGGSVDLACDVSALSAAWLGGLPFSTLAAAALVEERTPGALAMADAMFASTPLPFPFTWF